MSILIENYRGYNIYFRPDSENFSCEIDTHSVFERQSFSSAKKFIDNHIEDNIVFKPFLAQYKDSGKIINIVGIRKDGRFIKDDNGKKEQISDYDLNGIIVYDKGNEKFYAQIASIEADITTLRLKIKSIKESIIGEGIKPIKENYKPLFT